MKLFLLALLTTSSVFAQGTSFLWERDLKRPEKGNCYQVDTETMGQKFRAKVDLVDCKPKETHYLFVPAKSSCYEVDSETNGKGYIKKEKIKFCRPDKTVKEVHSFNRKTGCFEVDVQTKGQHFHKKINDKLCKDKISSTAPTNFYWKYKKEGTGECYKEIKSNGDSVNLKVKDEQCRPKKYQYRFVRKNETSGSCIEEDINDQRFYSKKTKIEYCKPKDTVFIYYKERNRKYGKCYEVDIETKGNLYINIVEDSECVPE